MVSIEYVLTVGELKSVSCVGNLRFIEDGTIIDLTATVKQHSEYGNRKQTILSRCIIKKVG